MLLELRQGLLPMGTEILLQSHWAKFPLSLRREADVTGLPQKDAASEDLLVISFMGLSPGSFSHQYRGTNSGQKATLARSSLGI